MNSESPKLQKRLDALLEERSSDVETMRERTTPWADFVDDKAVDMGLKRVKSGQRVGRISRIRAEGTGERDADALAMIERWADEVVGEVWAC